MKLRQAILMGRFCGLETVGECIQNIELHYWDVISYKELEKEQKEFEADITAWEAGELILDWPEIEKEVAQQWKDYEEYERKRTQQPVEEVDFELPALL